MKPIFLVFAIGILGLGSVRVSASALENAEDTSAITPPLVLVQPSLSSTQGTDSMSAQNKTKRAQRLVRIGVGVVAVALFIVAILPGVGALGAALCGGLSAGLGAAILIDVNGITYTRQKIPSTGEEKHLEKHHGSS